MIPSGVLLLLFVVAVLGVPFAKRAALTPESEDRWVKGITAGGLLVIVLSSLANVAGTAA